MTTSFHCIKINYNTGSVISQTPITDGTYLAAQTKPTWSHRRAAVRFIPESFMFWVSTGNNAVAFNNIFLVNFQEGLKAIILPATTGQEASSYIFSDVITGPNKELFEAGVSQVIVGPKI